ncbi:MAG TPA: protein translocase subunit SecDF [Lutibacter sp.]|nr:protein translocase subunit SecDF [Lutibacter sp.]
MQNKGLIYTFAILFGLVSLYSISFTYSTNRVEKKAFEYANSVVTNDDGKELARVERHYLDSVANDTNLYFNLFTYNDIKEKSLNLGLDLKGGINAILQVSVKDILLGLSNDSKNTVFKQALAAATEAQKTETKPFVSIFFDKFTELSDGNVKLGDPDIFGNKSLQDKINFNMTDKEVMPIIEEEVSNSISTAFRVLRTRIDKFGVTQPNIQRIGKSGRILIELPGAKDIHRVKNLLQSTAELQFWEVYSNQEISQFLIAANGKVQELLKKDTTVETDSTEVDEKSISELLGGEEDPTAEKEKVDNLFSVLSPNITQAQYTTSVIGYASLKDTAKVNKYLKMSEVRALLPADKKYTKFLWDAKPNKDSEIIRLYAIKSKRDGKAPIEGDVIDDATQTFDQLGINPEVSMRMNSYGAKLWGKMTTANVGKFVAVVLDDYVYTAPRVNDAILTGSTSISGQFDINEARDLANVLKAGKLPAKAHIVQSEIVGPSLGKVAISKSISSFVLALILVLIWMLFYYGKAGGFANIALIINILFIFGILTAFGFVLTLPGTAGIILTIGMSVDANVIIFERIKEELAKGKKLKQAIADGFSFKGALSAIIDANITTLLTGVILYMFGTGPVQGFALTLIIGILTSLFTAIFLTRMLIDWYITKSDNLTFNTSITKGWFQNMDIDFLKKRKIAYAISGVVILIGIGSLFTNSLNYGVDFKGGRSFVVKFEQAPNANEVKTALKEVFESAPEVKTYGSDNQLKITTKFRIEEEGSTVDDELQMALFTGLQSFLPDGSTLETFKGGFDNQKFGIMSSIKVEPTIADDIKQAAGWAIFGSLFIVFLYILLRFKKWQYSLGAVAAVFHDVLIVLAIFSIFWKILPFDMEIGQSFIAAILTVLGYSLNDTVVIFDRVREFAGLHKRWSFSKVVNKGLSSTLGRTINTSMTTLVVLLAIFLFGGDSIKGFMFALIVGVVVGTYSSLFVASPIMYDTIGKSIKDKKE